MIHDRGLRHLAESLNRTAGGLSVDHLAHRPAGKWSIAEILDHLGRTYSGTVRGAERALDAGRPLARQPSLRERMLVLLVVEAGYFPSGRKAPRVAEPIGVAAADALAIARDHLQRMDDVLERAALKFGSNVGFLDHPVLGPLSIRQWRRFHWIHTCHHLRQIMARRIALTTAGTTDSREPR
jgi:hypothetical protein